MKLQLSYPLTPHSINQGFGVNGAYYRANGINILGHNGLDLYAYHGQPVYAAHDGTAFYETDDSQGHGVVIISDKPYDYKGGLSFYKTIYWHFATPSATYPQLVTNGQQVKRGQQIGWADSTGLSSGDHCHFGLKPITTGTAPSVGDAPDVNIGAWVNQEPNNGFLGAIDPTPYFDGSYAHVATLPPGTKVSFETALTSIFRDLPPGIVRTMAINIIKKVYGR